MTMTSFQNILLIGSTGTIGSAIRKALIAQKSYFTKIGVLTTSDSLANPKKKQVFDTLHSEGLQIVVSDLDEKETLMKALKGSNSPASWLTIKDGTQ
jgi:nucleoside-diphosphate-sugar epimerase